MIEAIFRSFQAIFTPMLNGNLTQIVGVKDEYTNHIGLNPP